QQALHRDLNRHFVVDHQNQADAVRQERRGEFASLTGRDGCSVRVRRADRDDAASADLRPYSQRVAEQLREAAHDRESQANALGAIALGIAELIELLEHVFQLVLRNAATGVPHLDAQLPAYAAAADHDATVVRIGDRIGDDVAHDA